MQRTNKPNKFKAFYNKMSIKNKIALVYSTVFILFIFIVSCSIIINSIIYYRTSSEKEINETLDEIEEYIQNGGEISIESIKQQVQNPYIEVRIMEMRNGSPMIPTASDTRGGRQGAKPSTKPDTKPDAMPDPFYDDSTATDSATEYVPIPERSNMRGPMNDKFSNSPDGRGRDLRMGKIDGDAYLIKSKQVTIDGKTYEIRAFRIYNREIMLINKMGMLFIIENLAAVFIAFAVGRAISSKMLKPVHQVADAAIKISEENFNQRIEEPEADDEIRMLVRAFNDMLSRLEISFERQNQFISDVSHELKTPLSVIKGYTDMLSRWGKNDPEVLDESIESITSETEHMTMLINRLLFWARNDVNSSMTISELCIEELLEEIRKEASVMELPAKIYIDGAQSTRISGDYHLIKQLIWIFVENAVKYSGEKNCEIHFETSETADRAMLKIRDNGIGIKEEDIKNIFERFYRSDKSRNKEISGFGLGLSIAKWIVDHHNGKISVTSTFGEGTEFLLDFPRAR